MFSTEDQCARISAIRVAVGAGFFINAHTDVFMLAGAADHCGLIGDVVARGQAYAAAGASGLFVLIMNDIALIKQVCAQVPLPVNVMMHGTLPDRADLQTAGVARIS
ncbi:isocitrate lyase/phosphoenolpyruvate mutase family protein [Sulfitobacter sp. F26169L]|nr:isocitrate lyase/phosphoenolpyruvate mutase family protein [Sulfitobacter sp. F26169L]